MCPTDLRLVFNSNNAIQDTRTTETELFQVNYRKTTTRLPSCAQKTSSPQAVRLLLNININDVVIRPRRSQKRFEYQTGTSESYRFYFYQMNT